MNFQGKIDVHLGKLLVCGAIINSDYIDNADDDEFQLIVQTLQKGLAKKALISISYTFLIDLAQKVLITEKLKSLAFDVYNNALIF